jgi:hypothetical protein
MTAEPGFNRAGIAVMITLGVLFAAAFVLLSIYGPALKPGRDGGAHGLSTAATGYAGIVALGNAAGLSARVGRDGRATQTAGLLVVTPEMNTLPADLDALLRERNGAPTLIVLPKWLTVPKRLHPGWVEAVGPLPAGGQAAVLREKLPGLTIGENVVKAGSRLGDAENQAVVLTAPAATRSVSAPRGLDPVITDAAGHMVVGWNAKNNLYVLAEPDLLNNRALVDPAAARGAVQMLAALGGNRPGGLVFDVTLNGFAIGQSLLRTAFEPPFLALTLALLIAGGLAFWNGLLRFGTPLPAPRAIPFGKLALVDNAAGLIRMVGREADVAPRYAAMVAEAAATRLHAPAGLDAAATAAWLDDRGTGFAGLADAAAAATGRDDTLAAAQALHRWQETIHERR